jgi:hypothetical protein
MSMYRSELEHQADLAALRRDELSQTIGVLTDKLTSTFDLKARARGAARDLRSSAGRKLSEGGRLISEGGRKIGEGGRKIGEGSRKIGPDQLLKATVAVGAAAAAGAGVAHLRRAHH